MLEITELSAGYEPGKPILQNFNLLLEEGERIGITGQNGCGKSTLAKAIMGITPYTQGTVLWQGKPLLSQKSYTRNNQGIAYFMQGGKVFGNLSVKENLFFALQNKKNANFAHEMSRLSEFDFALFKDNRRMQLEASNLSGGERHLLAFAMVLLGCPDMKLLIADEPSAGVAQKTQNELLDIINNTLQKQNTALLLIEQNINFLNKLTNRRIKLTV